MAGYLRQFHSIGAENRKHFGDSLDVNRKVREDCNNLVNQVFLNLEKMACAQIQ